VTTDVLIAGGGIVGAAIAAAFREEGGKCLVVEPQTIGGGATAAGMGHVVVMDDSPAQLALTEYSRRLWDALPVPPNVEREHRGTLWVAADAEEMAEVARKHALFPASEILDERSLYEAEPQLRPGLAGGLLVPGDSVLYAPTAAAWLLRLTPVRYTAIESLTPDGACLSDGTQVSAGLTILACGTGITRLLPELPIKPRKGHLAITDRYPGFLHHQLVELGYLKSAHGHSNESVAFNVQPRSTGQILIGSSRQYGDESPDVRPELLSRMLRRAVEYMPRLVDLQVIRTWTGFRAATPDSLPLIGPVRDRVWVAAGHEGLGITTSLGSAALLLDRLLGDTPAIPPEPYLPERFL
jgi:D-hydroxyproline dehydrogenase subunit beta